MFRTPRPLFSNWHPVGPTPEPLTPVFENRFSSPQNPPPAPFVPIREINQHRYFPKDSTKYIAFKSHSYRPRYHKASLVNSKNLVASAPVPYFQPLSLSALFTFHAG